MVALVAIGCLFYACSDEELSDVSPQEADFTVRVKNGYLEFKDQATFDEINSSLKDKDREALDAWESQFKGFTSLRSVDEKSIDAQDEYFDKLSKMDEEELKTIKQQKGDDFFYSDFLLNHKDIFILEGEGVYHLNLPLFVFDKVKFLNRKGLVQIGDSLYQYGANTIKIIQDGNYQKLKGLSRVTENNENLGIAVHKIERKQIQLYNTSRFSGEVNASPLIRAYACEDTRDRDRVKGFVEQGYGKGTPPGYPFSVIAYFPYVDVWAENWRRDGIFGGWTRKRTSSLRIEGSIQVNGPAGLNSGTFDINVRATRLTPYIQTRAWQVGPSTEAGSWFSGPFTFTVDGEVRVYGRGGTSCTI